MNDNRRKKLTLFLGKCWHEINPNKRGEWCQHCKKYFWDERLTGSSHTFTTAQDMVDLAKRLVETKKWDTFMDQHISSKLYDDGNPWSIPRLFAWLLTDPARTCDLVGEFLEGEDEQRPGTR